VSYHTAIGPKMKKVRSVRPSAHAGPHGHKTQGHASDPTAKMKTQKAKADAPGAKSANGKRH